MIDEKLNEYFEKFGEGFPTIPLFWGKSDEEIINMINYCLKENKSAYDLGLVKKNNEIVY